MSQTAGPDRGGAPGPDESLLARAWGWLRSRLLKLALWAVSLFVASLAIPAITKQWSDRQAEAGIKYALLTDVARHEGAAFTAALRLASTPSSQTATRRAAVLDAWSEFRNEINVRIAFNFPHSRVQRDWDEYQNRVYYYVALACCDPRRADDLHWMGQFLRYRPIFPKAQDNTALLNKLKCGPPEPCVYVPKNYFNDFWTLGRMMLEQRASQLQTDLTNAKTSGFSRGWGDFVNDLTGPFRP